MTPHEINALATRAKSDPTTANLHELWHAVSDCVEAWAKSQRSRMQRGTGRLVCDDLASGGYPAMLDALRTYKPGRGNFTVVLLYRLRDVQREAMRLAFPITTPLRTRNEHVFETSRDQLRGIVGREPEPEREEVPIVPILASMTASGRKVAMLRYGLGGQWPLPWRDVAKSMGLSECAVQKHHRINLRRARAMLESRGIHVHAA